MTRIRDRHGYTRRMPARLLAWRLLLAPKWAWRRHPRITIACAAAVCLALAAAWASSGPPGCPAPVSRYHAPAPGCR